MRPVAAAAVALALVACSGGDRERPAPERPPRYPDLVGVWTAELEAPSVGPVSARVRVLPSGAVIVSAVVKGMPLHETGRIEAWDGARLRVRRGVAGERYEVAARLEGDTLLVVVPGAGEVRLTRAPRTVLNRKTTVVEAAADKPARASRRIFRRDAATEAARAPHRSVRGGT